MARLSRQESQARTRADVVATARRLFLDEGMSMTSLERIADEAGYTRGAVYSNFRNKAELCVEVLEQIRAGWLTQLAEIAAAPVSLKQQIERLQDWAQSSLGNTGEMTFFLEVGLTGRSDKRIQEWREKHQVLMRQTVIYLLKSTFQSHGITLPHSPERMADVLLSSAAGVGVQRTVDPHAAAEAFNDTLNLLLGPSLETELNPVQQTLPLAPRPNLNEIQSRWILGAIPRRATRYWARRGGWSR